MSHGSGQITGRMSGDWPAIPGMSRLSGDMEYSPALWCAVNLAPPGDALFSI
jgi:hypothetical protein